MFKDLKIATGINILLSILIIFIVVIASFSLSGSFETSNNFDDVVTTTGNSDALSTAMLGISAGTRRVNSLMLAQALNRPVSEDAIKSVRDDFTHAKAKMDEFMSTPFNTPAEKTKADVVKLQFDRVLAIVMNKTQYITSPASYPNNLDSDSSAQETLRAKANDYLQLSAGLSAGYVEKSKDAANRMMIIAIVILCLAVASFFLSRVWLKRAIFARLEQANNTFRAIAAGNLSQKVVSGAQNEIGLMLAELEKMRYSLTQTVCGIRNGVEHIYSSVRDIASSNNDLSSRTEEQASALQQTAASMEELKITVRQNADNAHSAKQLAESASVSARKGGDVMVNLNGIMHEITENSRQIADINSVIDSIANQTNILALNAAVEAARAGEQGRGFAVVAGEVRNLAKRSAEAAKEIRQLINTCVSNMHTGSQEVDLAGASMQEIVKYVIQVTDIMAEITSASDEQSTGINQIAQAVNEMDLVTQQNAAMVEQSAQMASNVEEHTGELNQMVSRFIVDANTAAPAGGKRVVRLPETISVPVSKELVSTETQEEQWETF